MKLKPAQELFVNSTYTKFHKNSTSFLVTATTSDMDERWKTDVFSMEGMYCLLYTDSWKAKNGIL